MRRTAAAPKPHAQFAQNWQRLHDQAGEVAELAGISREKFEGEIAAFPGHLCDAGEAAQELAWQGIEDIDAMLQPGLTALRTITARGQDASVPALALWREFHCARAAILRLTGADHSAAIGRNAP